MSTTWPTYLPVVTVVDVLDTGACYDGVVSWIENNGLVIAGPTERQTNEYILKAANGYGYGDGYGDGDGA